MSTVIVRHVVRVSALLSVLFLLLAPKAAQAQCSAPYFLDQRFPTTGIEETRWRICWQVLPGNGLVITSAHFRKSPTSPFVRLFWDARISEIFVPYHDNSNRFLDVAYGFPSVPLNAKDCPPAKGGTVLGSGSEVCKEVRDRGLAWKDDTQVRRGEEVVLWSTIDAANYNYVVEWTFRDDGAVIGRAGATAMNYPSTPFTAHMHGPIWRLDIDLNGFAGDSVHLGTHTESGLTATDTEPLIATETGIQWDPLSFTSLYVHDATLKNAKGHPSAYHLMPIRNGTPRHQEPFTKNDFWVTKYKSSEMYGPSLPTYISPAESVSNTDIVIWYYGGAHHLVRDEDGEVVAGLWQGETHIMWTGFMLKPHNLFDKTPLFP